MKTTETPYQYHRREFEEFAKEEWTNQVEDGTWNDDEVPDFDDFYIRDLAEIYWAEFENIQDVDNAHNNIEYSAGVYLFEIDDNNITNRVIINDVKWYDDEGEEVTKEVDMIDVTLMNTNPDLYGDKCEEAVSDELNKLIETKEIVEICELAQLVGINRVEAIASHITREIIKNQPELLEVLAEWNQDHSIDEVIEFFCESNQGTVTQLLEDM